MSSVTGNRLKLSVFGESHGEAVGCVIDGFPCGIKVDFDSIYTDMARRAPGKDSASTKRLEKDIPRVLSGIKDGVTTGAPIAVIIENTNVKSSDYKELKSIPRPSHSDYPAFVKFGGYNDISGGGHFSGRLTAPIVFAGALAKQALALKGVTVGAHIKKIGSVSDTEFDKNNIDKALLNSLAIKSFSVINPESEEKMRAEIEKYKNDKNSVGGEIECAAVGLPVGIGGNMFDTVEGTLSRLLFGIPAVKGVSFGLGFGFAEADAKTVNDGYEYRNGRVCLLSNNNGGVLGGMTSGAPLIVNTVIKPTPSISSPQKSVNLETKENETLTVCGRHDPCIVPRAVPVIEAAVAVGILDLML